jgi:hypothetical protein
MEEARLIRAFKEIGEKLEMQALACQIESGFVNHWMAAFDSGDRCCGTGAAPIPVRGQRRGLKCAFC